MEIFMTNFQFQIIKKYDRMQNVLKIPSFHITCCDN